MDIALVLGTARIGRRSERVAQHLESILSQEKEHVIHYVDVREQLKTFATTRYDVESTEPYTWHDIAVRSEGFIFVIPEYSHSYPGEWKLLMDSLRSPAYAGKVAGLVGVSDGYFGGARAVEQATLTLSHRGMYVLKQNLFFPNVQNIFTESEDKIDDVLAKRTEDFIRSFLDTVRLFGTRK